MSKPSLIIDNIAFAKKHEKLQSELTLNDCPRLTALLVESAGGSHEGSIQYILEGETNSLGQHILHLSLTAQLNVKCQRCLEAMPLSLDLEYQYLITSIASDQPEESDDVDLQEPSADMDIAALIEDEVIMALPFAPTHAEACGPQVTQSGEKPNPFAALKGLLKP